MDDGSIVRNWIAMNLHLLISQELIRQKLDINLVGKAFVELLFLHEVRDAPNDCFEKFSVFHFLNAALLTRLPAPVGLVPASIPWLLVLITSIVWVHLFAMILPQLTGWVFLPLCIYRVHLNIILIKLIIIIQHNLGSKINMNVKLLSK